MRKNVYFFLSIISLIGCSHHQNRNSTSTKIILDRTIDSALSANLTHLERIRTTKKAVGLIFEKSNDTLYTSQLISCAENYFNMNDWYDLKTLSQKMRERALKYNNFIELACAYKQLGNYYMYKSINDSALYFFLEERKIYLHGKLYSKLSENYIQLTQLKYYINDYLGAEESALDGYKLASQYNLPHKKFQSLIWLGILSAEQGEIKKSNEYYEKALTLSINDRVLKNDSYFKSACYGYIGYNYFNQDMVKESLIYYNYAIDDFHSINSYPDHYAKMLDCIGDSQFKINKYNNLPDLWTAATKIRDSFNVDNGRNYNCLSLSKYYFHVGDTFNAKKQAEHALKLSRIYNSPKDMMTMLKHLASIDRRKSYQYIQEHIKLSDSLQLAERKMRNKFARIAYETELITNERNLAIKNKWIILGIASSIILGGILLITIKTQRIRQTELVFLHEQQRKDELIYNLIHDSQGKLNFGRESEKKRISKVLQETIMNRLSHIRNNLKALNHENNTESVKKLLPFIDKIQDVEKDVRLIAHNLDNELFSQSETYTKTLQNLFDQQPYKVLADVDQAIKWDAVPSIIKMNIYQILHEILQQQQIGKTLKLYIGICFISEGIEIALISTSVENNNETNRFDISSLKKRASFFGGRISIHNDNQVPKIRITIPYVQPG